MIAADFCIREKPQRMGLNQSGRQEHTLSRERFGALADLAGQFRAQILELGATVFLYGSQGFASGHRWNGNQF
jgi:hypothetical protein